MLRRQQRTSAGGGLAAVGVSVNGGTGVDGGVWWWGAEHPLAGVAVDGATPGDRALGAAVKAQQVPSLLTAWVVAPLRRVREQRKCRGGGAGAARALAGVPTSRCSRCPPAQRAANTCTPVGLRAAVSPVRLPAGSRLQAAPGGRSLSGAAPPSGRRQACQPPPCRTSPCSSPALPACKRVPDRELRGGRVNGPHAAKDSSRAIAG